MLATGTSATGTATATGLTANTQYTAYFRGLCDDLGVGDDPSAWSSIALNFRTKVGCGGPYNLCRCLLGECLLERSSWSLHQHASERLHHPAFPFLVRGHVRPRDGIRHHLRTRTGLQYT